MKAQLIDSHHCVMIDNVQIDLFYSFESSQMTVYVEGKQQLITRFHPQRQILNYSNVLEVCTVYYEAYLKRESQFI